MNDFDRLVHRVHEKDLHEIGALKRVLEKFPDHERLILWAVYRFDPGSEEVRDLDDADSRNRLAAEFAEIEEGDNEWDEIFPPPMRDDEEVDDEPQEGPLDDIIALVLRSYNNTRYSLPRS